MKRIAEECAGQTDLLFKFNLPQWSRSDQPSLVWDTYESLSSIFKQYLQNMFQVFMIDGSSLFKFTEDIKNLIETSKANIHSLYSHIDSLKTRIKHNTRAILSAVRLKLLELQDLTIQWLRHAEEQTILTVQGIVVDLQKQGITLMQYAYDVKDTLQTFMLHVYDLASDLISILIEIDEVKFLIRYAMDIYREYVNFDKLHQFIIGLCQLVVEDVQRNFSDLTSFVLSLAENYYIQNIRNFVSIVYQKVCWSWSYLHLTSRLERLLYSRFESVLYELIFSTTDRTISRYNLSVENRYIEFEQSIPIEWESFDTLPKYDQLLVKLDKLVNSDGAGLMSDVENFKYSVYEKLSTGFGLSLDDKPVGLIMGNQLLTFDRTLVELMQTNGTAGVNVGAGALAGINGAMGGDKLGSLPAGINRAMAGVYVLSYETRDEKWVLLMEYTDKNEKLIHFWTGGDKLTLNMATQNILLNGSPIELPYELSLNAYIVKVDESRVRISYDEHITMVCHLGQDICVVQLSPWMYGKTVGLLGNFDYESYNDLSLPNGTLTTNRHCLLEAWKLSDATPLINEHQHHHEDLEDLKSGLETNHPANSDLDSEENFLDRDTPTHPQPNTTVTGLADLGLAKDLTHLLESNESFSLHSLLAKIKSSTSGPMAESEQKSFSGSEERKFVGSGSEGPTVLNYGSGPEGPTVLTYSQVRQCESYFLHSRVSDLCWNQLDTRQFYSLCVRSGDPCRTIYAFISTCREIDFEVQLEPPSFCVQCQLNNRTLLSGRSLSLHNTEKSNNQHDIVFLVNSYETDCLDELNMTTLLTQMYNQAKTSQATLGDIRIGFVVFNNNKYNSDIQLYTSEQKMWTTDAQQAASTFQRILSDKCAYTPCGDVTTVFDSLKFVSKLSFRPGVTRSVVLLQCSQCTDKRGYSDMLAMLQESSIKLHILSTQSFTHLNSNLVGMDATDVFAKDGSHSSVQANPVLRKQFVAPKDFCSSLALSTQGSLFALPSHSNSQLYIVYSRLILKSQAGYSRCEKCDCVAGDDWSGRLRCYRCGVGLTYDYELDLDDRLGVDYSEEYTDPLVTLVVNFR
uniref:Apolipophorins n=1 Tax=Cacopsylla melanoneura TaxID=428564 RepID=A0A8D9B621_9HEMI